MFHQVLQSNISIQNYNIKSTNRTNPKLFQWALAQRNLRRKLFDQVLELPNKKNTHTQIRHKTKNEQTFEQARPPEPPPTTIKS